MNSSISSSSAMLRLQGLFLALFFFFFPLSSARREEAETATDTHDETDDSRERSGGGVGDLDRSRTSPSVASVATCVAGVASVATGVSGRPVSAGISTYGSAALNEDDDGVFLPFLRPRVDDSCIFFFGAMLILTTGVGLLQ